MSDIYTARQFGYEQRVLVIIVPILALVVAATFASTGEIADYWLGLLLSEAVIIGLLWLPLTILVTPTQIKVRLALLWRRDIALADVVSVDARDYSALRQFGGWGWRFGREESRAYTMNGNSAAVVTLRDGQEVYLGARDTNALAEAIGERVRV